MSVHEGRLTQTSICRIVIIDFLARSLRSGKEGYAFCSKYNSKSGVYSYDVGINALFSEEFYLALTLLNGVLEFLQMELYLEFAERIRAFINGSWLA